MGRTKKYLTPEEKRVANNKKVKQFYWKNKNKLDNKAKAYYWKKKIETLVEQGKIDDAIKVKNKALTKGVIQDELGNVIEILIEKEKELLNGQQ